MACCPFLPFVSIPLAGQVNFFILVEAEHDPVGLAWAVVAAGGFIALASLIVAGDLAPRVLAAIGIAATIISGVLGVVFLLPHLNEVVGGVRGSGGPGLVGAGIPAAAVIYLLFVAAFVRLPIDPRDEAGTSARSLSAIPSIGIAFAVAAVIAIVAVGR